MKLKCMLVLLFCSLFSCVAIGLSARKANNEHLISIRSIKLNGELASLGNFEFELVLRLELFKLLSDTTLRFWGSYYDSAHTVIDKMEITVAGKRLQIPEQALSDLAQIDIGGGVRVGEENKKVFVFLSSMQGLDTTYDATFTFDEKRLIKRMIEYSEIGKEGGVVITEY